MTLSYRRHHNELIMNLLNILESILYFYTRKAYLNLSCKMRYNVTATFCSTMLMPQHIKEMSFRIIFVSVRHIIVILGPHPEVVRLYIKRSVLTMVRVLQLPI